MSTINPLFIYDCSTSKINLIELTKINNNINIQYLTY